MREIICSEPFILALVLCSYYVGLRIERATRLSFANPLLIALIIIIPTLCLLDIDYPTFERGSHFINFLLGPSVVALGFTLHRQIDLIKGNVMAILCAIFAGSVVGIVSVIIICRLLGAPQEVITSLQPKSVTTPIALGISANTGGIVSLTAITVVICGILGSVAGPAMLKVLLIRNKIAKGLALGAAAHGIGTSRAMQMGPVEGAFGGMAIGLMGVITAILVPVIMKIIESLGI